PRLASRRLGVAGVRSGPPETEGAPVISLNRVHGCRSRRVGAVVAAATLAMAAAPAAASAQDSGESGSRGGSVGVIQAEIVVGGRTNGGTGGTRDVSGGAVPEAAQAVAEVAGSLAPREAVGSTGGSAAASVASSRSVPGSVYANPTGSAGSGTLGLGSGAAPEYGLPMLYVQFAGGYFT